MGLTDYKVTSAALDTKGVIAAPDTLTGRAEENKAVFDRLSREVVAPSLNGVIDTLAGTDGAANVGAAVDGVAGDNVQAVLDGMLPAVRSAAAAAAASADEAAAYARQAAAHTDLPITRGTGRDSLVMGDIVNNKASSYYSFAEGENTWAAGQAAHAEGSGTKAWDFGAHAEGAGTTAYGLASHAEGSDTEARGWHSHAEGYGTLADSSFSHAEGRGTKAQGNAQHAFGRYNDTAAGCVEVVGNGTADDARSNARTLDWNGNEWLAGKLTMEGTPTADKDAATKKYVDDAAAALVPRVGKGRNLLDNAYFIGGGTAGAFPINQNGKTGSSAYTNADRTVDRWWNYAGTTVGVEADGLALSATTALFQMFEPSRMRLGETYTLSAIVNGVCYSATFDYAATSTVASINCGTAQLRFYGDMWSQTPSKNGVGFDSVTDATKVSAIKLELGSRQTLARKVGNAWVLNDPPPDYGEELAKCQRYLCKFVQYMAFAPSTGANTDAFVTLPVCMARKPDIIGNIANGINWNVVIYSPYSNQLRIRSATVIAGAVECDGDVYFSAE